MKTKLGKGNRIRVPEELIAGMQLEKGDLFEITQMNGTIVLLPLSPRPKDCIREIRAEIDILKEAVKKGEVPDFGAVERLLSVLEEI